MTGGNQPDPPGVHPGMTTSPPQLEGRGGTPHRLGPPGSPQPPSSPPPSPPPTRAGDFDDFYRAAYADVASALVLTLGNADLGREATDEAMVRAWERWDRIATYDNPGGWAYRVGLNWALSWRRKAARQWPFRSERTTPPVELADPSITAALQDLPVPQRSVVVCRLLLDWSTEQTAEALRIRPGTVKSRLHRALTTLERRLEDLR